ncbi:MAG TPA: DUF1552 domain-containing protein [Polyangia bacterium]|jgi:hypothetical protein
MKMPPMKRLPSRRTILRGAGVALTLPFLESLGPRPLRAQAVDVPRRFLPIYLPNGAPDLWLPSGVGSGDAWQLSSLLEPFGAALKPKVTVVTNLENGSVFNPDGSPQITSPHGRLGGAWLTCVDAAAVRTKLGLDEANGISVDQVLAQQQSAKTPLASLQVGLSTPFGNCDGEPCSSSRSVSWASATQPTYKLVDPFDVFNQIMGVAKQPDPTGAEAIEAQKRLARNKSVLDGVLQNAQRTRARLGADDQKTMDGFLDSVRAVEQRVVGLSSGMGGAACSLPSADDLPRVQQSATGPRQSSSVAPVYSKGAHADAMNDLIALAFECDVTRVISYMLEDERSEFTYDEVQERAFSADTSAPKGGACPEYHASQHAGGDVFATITWWNVGKVADLCRKLDGIKEANGATVLDNCVVFLGACMHGGDHLGDRLPVALVGGANLGLKNDQHLVLDQRPLRDLYFTFLNDVYGVNVNDFGQNLTGAPPTRIAELLKG